MTLKALLNLEFVARAATVAILAAVIVHEWTSPASSVIWRICVTALAGLALGGSVLGFLLRRRTEDVDEVPKVKLKPLADRVLVKPVPALTASEPGIFLPDTAKEKPSEGEVIAVGAGKTVAAGRRFPVKAGDRVLFEKAAGTEMKMGGDELFILTEDDILSVLGPPAATESTAPEQRVSPQQQQQQQQQQQWDPAPAAPPNPAQGTAPVEREVETDVALPLRYEHDYIATRRYRVWFGTDREPANEEATEPYFSRNFDPQLHFGSCLVYVPNSHRFGEIKSSWLKRKFNTLVLRQEDDTLRIVQVESLDAEGFGAGLSNELRHWTRRTALVFVHGYNVSFREAALRAAQIGFDLRVEGTMAFFSWPSKGDLVPYAADGASVELAEDHFIQFLERLSSVQDLEEINILAHSMGNRLLLRTVDSLLRSRQAGTLKVPIGQIILAAADVTAEKLRQTAAAYTSLAARRVTNYSYQADKALMLSRKLHDQPRAGFEPPVFIHTGVDSVSVSRLDLDLLGHGYIAAAAPLLYDLSQLVHENKPPRNRTRLEPAPPEPSTYWLLAP